MKSVTDILVVDLGGTKAHVGLCNVNHAQGAHRSVELVREAIVPCVGYRGIEPILKEFCDRLPTPPPIVALGIAGPVSGDYGHVTNLGWQVAKTSVAQATGATKVLLLNDLEAHGYGTLVLEAQHVHTLNIGRPRAGNRALIAAGTGLGEAILFWDGMHHKPAACEGGHATFAPDDSVGWQIMRTLKERFGHVSWERVVSGGEGFGYIFDALVSQGMSAPEYLIKERQGRPFGPAVAAAAQAGVEVARETVRLFCTWYGAEAGNLALKAMATDGLYIGGGIAPKILPWIETYFMPAFSAKGRFRELLLEIPVRVILDPHNALHGLAWAAAQAR